MGWGKRAYRNSRIETYPVPRNQLGTELVRTGKLDQVRYTQNPPVLLSLSDTLCPFYLLSRCPIPVYCSRTLPNVCLLFFHTTQYVTFLFTLFLLFVNMWIKIQRKTTQNRWFLPWTLNIIWCMSEVVSFQW